jgi:hypothetical protein
MSGGVGCERSAYASAWRNFECPAGGRLRFVSGALEDGQRKKIERPATPVWELMPRFGLSVPAFEMCCKRYPA